MNTIKQISKKYNISDDDMQKLFQNNFNAYIEGMQKMEEPYKSIKAELSRAEGLYPDYPTNIFMQLAIMHEEAGEVTKATLDYMTGKHGIQELKDELIQTAAMCVRMLKNLEV